MFTCPLCSKNFGTRRNLETHTRSHTKEKPHKCLICSATFGLAKYLKRHEKCVHGGLKIIRKKNIHCTLCSYKCCTNTQLRVHLRKHSDQLLFSCIVPSCGFKTKYEQSLKKHVRTFHSDERFYECSSDGCSYKSKTKGDLTTHIRLHSNEKPFTCKVPGCDYACKMKSYLKPHISRAHSDKKPFKCVTCDFRAKSRSEVLQHQFTHVKTKRFQCHAPNCGYVSNKISVIEGHFDAKHRKKHLRCTESGCNYRCSSIFLLKAHTMICKLPMLKCPFDLCNYSTKYERTNLIRHISRVHKDVLSTTVLGATGFDLEIAGTANAIETLHCHFPKCGYQTKIPHHYDRHRNTHDEGEKRKHVCTFCFSRFSRLNNLQTHVQSHIGEKPYSCSHCKCTYKHSCHLVKHARRIHHIHVTPRGTKRDELRRCRTCGRNCLSYSDFVSHSMSHLQPVVVLERLRVHTM